MSNKDENNNNTKENEKYLKLFCIGVLLNAAIITVDSFFFTVPYLVSISVGGIGALMVLVAAFKLVKLKK